MRNIIAICKRELLSFFVSPVAYFVITGFTLLAGFFFFSYLAMFYRTFAMYQSMPFGMMPDLNLNQTVIEGFYQTLIVILVFLIPLLTMRVIAEEKRRGTFELLITSPVSVGQIILGKFLSLAVVITVMLVLSLVFPLLLVSVTNPEVAPIFTGFLAVWMCAIAFASVGMAVSSFTENQIVAGVSSMVTLLLLYVIQAPSESLGGTAGEVLKYLSPIEQIQDLVKGVITLQSIVYFVSLAVFGLFLSQRALDSFRWR
jgi:ABC-2 type transport system permease protein